MRLSYSTGINLFKFNNGNKKTMRRTCSKLAIKLQHSSTTFYCFITNFEQISHIILMFPVLSLNKKMPAKYFLYKFYKKRVTPTAIAMFGLLPALCLLSQLIVHWFSQKNWIYFFSAYSPCSPTLSTFFLPKISKLLSHGPQLSKKLFDDPAGRKSFFHFCIVKIYFSVEWW